MILTIELPDESIVKYNVDNDTTLKEIAMLVGLKNPAFFCDRWSRVVGTNGELGTLISIYPTDEPIHKFNTTSIVLIDKRHIQEKDVPRYYCAMTKGY